ncbi:MAG: metal-dependent transcriptional regulator [Acidimicrobiaceae bacterium]|nr:metal-dependent transcriptional regulator [Acidimicrobiaceae bacterium]
MVPAKTPAAAPATVPEAALDSAPYESPEWHPAFEEYCETIFELAEDDLDVIQARIADRLAISRPAVSEMIRRMQAEGLVEEGRGAIRLTPKGRSLAETVVRRHRLAERFLTDMLGLSWADAHQEAGKWEHVISPAVEDAMMRVLKQPTTCPHGNPIPGSDYEPPDMTPLGDLAVGQGFVVQRIPEELEFASGMLKFLEASRVTPGATGEVTARSPDGTLTLNVEGDAVGLSNYATERILVTAAGS